MAHNGRSNNFNVNGGDGNDHLDALAVVGQCATDHLLRPGINNFDFSVQKVTPISEGKRLEFRAEFFNIFNHTQFLNPDGNISDGADFGRVKRARDPRNIQFALKFGF
jgi:hypothetical protein